MCVLFYIYAFISFSTKPKCIKKWINKHWNYTSLMFNWERNTMATNDDNNMTIMMCVGNLGIGGKGWHTQLVALSWSACDRLCLCLDHS